MYILAAFILMAIIGAFTTTVATVFGIMFAIFALVANIIFRVISTMHYGQIKSAILRDHLAYDSLDTLCTYETARSHWFTKQFLQPMPQELKDYLVYRASQKGAGTEDR